ncbi:MAG: hypothetical protein AAB358_02680 [Patescibacteria group bacterium]
MSDLLQITKEEFLALPDEEKWMLFFQTRRANEAFAQASLEVLLNSVKAMPE